MSVRLVIIFCSILAIVTSPPLFNSVAANHLNKANINPTETCENTTDNQSSDDVPITTWDPDMVILLKATEFSLKMVTVSDHVFRSFILLPIPMKYWLEYFWSATYVGSNQFFHPQLPEVPLWLMGIFFIFPLALLTLNIYGIVVPVFPPDEFVYFLVRMYCCILTVASVSEMLPKQLRVAAVTLLIIPLGIGYRIQQAVRCLLVNSTAMALMTIINLILIKRIFTALLMWQFPWHLWPSIGIGIWLNFKRPRYSFEIW